MRKKLTGAGGEIEDQAVGGDVKAACAMEEEIGDADAGVENGDGEDRRGAGHGAERYGANIGGLKADAALKHEVHRFHGDGGVEACAKGRDNALADFSFSDGTRSEPRDGECDGGQKAEHEGDPLPEAEMDETAGWVRDQERPWVRNFR